MTVTSAAAALLFLLAVARMAGLVVQLERVLAQRHALQGELSYRATHDELNGIANRRQFTEQLGHALHRHPDGGVTVLYLDLDRFKAVNDSLGHGAGDTLLTVVADRLRTELRADDLARGAPTGSRRNAWQPRETQRRNRDGTDLVAKRPQPHTAGL